MDVSCPTVAMELSILRTMRKSSDEDVPMTAFVLYATCDYVSVEF